MMSFKKQILDHDLSQVFQRSETWWIDGRGKGDIHCAGTSSAPWLIFIHSLLILELLQEFMPSHFWFKSHALDGLGSFKSPVVLTQELLAPWVLKKPVHFRSSCFLFGVNLLMKQTADGA